MATIAISGMWMIVLIIAFLSILLLYFSFTKREDLPREYVGKIMGFSVFFLFVAALMRFFVFGFNSIWIGAAVGLSLGWFATQDERNKTPLAVLHFRRGVTLAIFAFALAFLIIFV